MDRVTLNDLTNENAYTYAQMLRKYKDKINEIIRYVNNINPAYQHFIHTYYEVDGEGFTLTFTFKNDDKNNYNLNKLIEKYASDGVSFSASGCIKIDGNVHNIDYITIDDVELGIGFVEGDSVGSASSYIAYAYEDLERSQEFKIFDKVNII